MQENAQLSDLEPNILSSATFLSILENKESLQLINFCSNIAICWLCSKSSPQTICPDCCEKLARIKSACVQCSLPLPGDQLAICAECQRQKNAFDRTICSLLYDHPSDYLITQFKQKRQFAIGHFLAEMLYQKIRIAIPSEDRPECIVPVPAHWTSVLQRGFNPAYFIAKILAKELKIPLVDCLRSKKKHDKQKQLSRKERLKNLNNVYQVKFTVPHKRVALIDDVVTTGATIQTLSTLLKNNGVQNIQVWALARTPK